jgi:hypothetical protein
MMVGMTANGFRTCAHAVPFIRYSEHTNSVSGSRGMLVEAEGDGKYMVYVNRLIVLPTWYPIPI